MTKWAHEAWHDWNNPLRDIPKSEPHGFGRLDAFGIIYNQLLTLAGSREAAKAPNAPVSYPYLWDTSQHDWTQWNGISPRIPKGRNIGQVIGTFGRFEFPPAFWVVASIPLDKIRDLQKLVNKLRSPAWPEEILGSIDIGGDAHNRGREFYKKHCLHCHAIQERDEPLRRINVHLADADGIGSLRTDPLTTYNAHFRKTDGPEGPKQIQSILLNTVTYLLLHPANFFANPREMFDTVVEFVSVPLECTGEWLWNGATKWRWEWKRCLTQDATKIFYKSRPLDGIWATAPYLHNGSVANLYELHLPADERTKEFCVGHREFDPERVGFVMLKKADCTKTWLDTSVPGNLNIGHEYGVQPCGKTDDKCRKDRHREISDLITYLKSL